MSQIKKFVDRVASAEGRQTREVLLPISDAKELRDEILKLLVDQREPNKNTNNEIIQVVATGGKW